MTGGFATAAGTARYASRFASHAEFFRDAQGLTVSSLGIGSYLGAMDDAADAGYIEAVNAALNGGINFIDTSLNYRNQRSERAIGRALAENGVARDEYVVCTKAGFLVPDAVPVGKITAADIVGNMHSMAPAFLEDQCERSRANLGLETIDVFYLHNPETQLRFVEEDVFEDRLKAAFEQCEKLVAERKIRFYGTATWDGYRQRHDAAKRLTLTRVASIAKQVGNNFRFIQLPLNLAMPEAYTYPNELVEDGPVNVLSAARALGITAVGSASILQKRLSKDLPAELAEKVPGLATDAQRAIQFSRSTPGMTLSLVGMGDKRHVEENLGLAARAPMALAEYLKLYEQ